MHTLVCLVILTLAVLSALRRISFKRLSVSSRSHLGLKASIVSVSGISSMSCTSEHFSLLARYVPNVAKSSIWHKGVFGVGLLSDASEMLPRPTLVAMATKFGSKLAITQVVWEISPRFLRLTGGFLGRAIERCESNSTTTERGCHGNEIWAGYISAYIRYISKILASIRV